MTMQRPVDALVTGFTKSPDLLARSLAPLRRLKHEGIIRDIHCVTWDSPELDPWLAPLHDLHEVRLTRVPQPALQGTPRQNGVRYQIENLKAALALVPDEPLILKWRPDFLARHAFLREKLVTFDRQAVVPPRTCFGVTMPAPVFGEKIWIPWADSNSPFFFEDAVFLGAKRDVGMLALSPAPEDMEILGDPQCSSYAHVLRFAKPFVSAYPLLRNYLRFSRYFWHDIEYRRQCVPYMIDNGFFWHILIAHAWILHSQFHVDVGAPSDLAFYANTVNRNADWSDFATLNVTSPYDTSAGWREGTKAGLALPSVSRAYGRLMDDGWQRALFTDDVPDLPRETLAALMANVAACADGRLDGIEAEFYQNLGHIHRNVPAASAA
jgi:hypothetical protein